MRRAFRGKLLTYVSRAALFALVMLLPAGAAVSSAAPDAANPAADIISIYIDGQRLEPDVPPQIINDRVMAPVRAISEAVGCRVEWDGEKRQVVIYAREGADPILLMRLEDPYVDVSVNSGGGQAVYERVMIDSPPVIYNDRTLVPVRFIAEYMGFDVEWGGVTRTVRLISGAPANRPLQSEGGDGSGVVSPPVWPGTFSSERANLEIKAAADGYISFDLSGRDDGQKLSGAAMIWPGDAFVAEYGGLYIVLSDDSGAVELYVDDGEAEFAAYTACAGTYERKK